ncbi:LEA type 2 family protein [Desulfococcus sp.]|uniref:LEA type 2 family protein n=1 Tax=Desulfococcus sp. TaxID=2025834 RepID=UPI003594194F
MQTDTGTTRSSKAETKSSPHARLWTHLRSWFLGGVVILAAAGILGGCAALGKRLETPRISLSRIEVESATFFEMVMGVTLRIFNTNDVPLTLKGADVSLEVNGKAFARGVSPIETTLPAYGTTLVPMTLYSSTMDMVEGFVKMKNRDALKYRVYGSVRIEGGFLLPSSLPFSSEGELSLDELQPEK